jgi:hypothetical protein
LTRQRRLVSQSQQKKLLRRLNKKHPNLNKKRLNLNLKKSLLLPLLEDPKPVVALREPQH